MTLICYTLYTFSTVHWFFQDRRRINEEINEYRKKFQRKEDRREYDLNDPEGLKKQLAPRCDGTAEISLASAQM